MSLHPRPPLPSALSLLLLSCRHHLSLVLCVFPKWNTVPEGRSCVWLPASPTQNSAHSRCSVRTPPHCHDTCAFSMPCPPLPTGHLPGRIPLCRRHLLGCKHTFYGRCCGNPPSGDAESACSALKSPGTPPILSCVLALQPLPAQDEHVPRSISLVGVHTSPDAQMTQLGSVKQEGSGCP